MSTVQFDRENMTDFHQWCSASAEDMTIWRDYQMIYEQQLDSGTDTGMVVNGVPLAMGTSGLNAGTMAGAVIAQRLSEALEAHRAITEAFNAIGKIVKQALADADHSDSVSEARINEIMTEHGWTPAILKALSAAVLKGVR